MPPVILQIPNNITVASTNGIARGGELKARTHSVIDLEHMGYTGVCYPDFSGIEYPTVSDIATSYPYLVHGRQCLANFLRT